MNQRRSHYGFHLKRGAGRNKERASPAGGAGGKGEPIREACVETSMPAGKNGYLRKGIRALREERTVEGQKEKFSSESLRPSLRAGASRVAFGRGPSPKRQQFPLESEKKRGEGASRLLSAAVQVRKGAGAARVARRKKWREKKKHEGTTILSTSRRPEKERQGTRWPSRGRRTRADGLLGVRREGKRGRSKEWKLKGKRRKKKRLRP